MSGAVQLIALAVAIVFIWLAVGFVRALRDALAQRAAGWLLPSDQPVTFRLAQLVAILARQLAPKRRFEFDFAIIFERVLPVRRIDNQWTEPESAVAELEADLEAKKRALEPLELVAPLLSRVLYMHVRNVYEIARGVAWLPLGIALLVFIALVVAPILRLIINELDKHE